MQVSSHCKSLAATWLVLCQSQVPRGWMSNVMFHIEPSRGWYVPLMMSQSHTCIHQNALSIQEDRWSITILFTHVYPFLLPLGKKKRFQEWFLFHSGHVFGDLNWQTSWQSSQPCICQQKKNAVLFMSCENLKKKKKKKQKWSFQQSRIIIPSAFHHVRLYRFNPSERSWFEKTIVPLPYGGSVCALWSIAVWYKQRFFLNNNQNLVWEGHAYRGMGLPWIGDTKLIVTS